jgi:hydroxymethylglutaryl-CoA reductase
MSVQPVQSHGLEQGIPPVRPAGVAGVAGDVSQSGATQQHAGMSDPRDHVVLSDQARQLAAVAAEKAAKGEVELQLDFRKLRALATASEQPSAGQ